MDLWDGVQGMILNWVDPSSSGVSGYKIRGLRNVGNTCYFNSCVQAWSSSKPVVEYVKNLSKDSHAKPFTKMLSTCLTDLRNSRGGSIDPSNILKHIQRSHANLQGDDQQDAVEVFDAINNCLSKDNVVMLRALQRSAFESGMLDLQNKPVGSIAPELDNVLINNPFQGMISSHLQCPHCCTLIPSATRFHPTRHQVFTVLPLTIPTATTVRTAAARESTAAAIQAGARGGGSGGNGGGGAVRHGATLAADVDRNPWEKISVYDCIGALFQDETLTEVTCNVCSIRSTQRAIKEESMALGCDDGNNGGLLLESKSAGAAAPEKKYVAPTVDDIRKNALLRQVLPEYARAVSSMHVVGQADAYIGDMDDVPKVVDGIIESCVTGQKSRSCSESSGESPSTTTMVDILGKGKVTNVSRKDRDIPPPERVLRAEEVVTMEQWLRTRLLSLQHKERHSLIKHTALSRLPKMLCLHISRRVYEANGRIRKRMEHVVFPYVLNMLPYCRADGAAPAAGASSTGNGGSKAHAGKKASTAPSREPERLKMFPGGVLTGTVAGISGMKLFGQYELRAVVEHLGNAEAGHYMAYCLVQQQPHRVWEMCSDERHHVVPEQTVMNTQATMLFYEAV